MFGWFRRKPLTRYEWVLQDLAKLGSQMINSAKDDDPITGTFAKFNSAASTAMGVLQVYKLHPAENSLFASLMSAAGRQDFDQTEEYFQIIVTRLSAKKGYDRGRAFLHCFLGEGSDADYRQLVG